MSEEKRLENRIEIEKSRYEIADNKHQIEKSQEVLKDLNKKVDRNRRLMILVMLLVVAIFMLIFINGMMVHHQTGLDEYQNAVFDGSEEGGILD